MNSLEEWIHSVIRQSLSEDSELRSFVGAGKSPEITQQVIERYQLFKLSQIVGYAGNRSHFYRNLFQGAGVNPDGVKSLDDFSELPFTEPRQLIENTNSFLCVPQSEVFRGFSADGTLSSMRVLYSRDELDRIVDSIAAALRTVGLAKGDALQVMFPPEAEWGCDYLVSRAAESIGAAARVTGHVFLDEQVQKMREFKATLAIGSNPYIYIITGLAGKEHALKKLGLRAIILSRGCDYYPFDEAIRQEVEDAWGCKAYDQYGTIETGLAISMECPAQNGLHINEADFFVETVDPESGEVLEAGEEGELVFTTLSRRCMPLVRYRSRDVSRLVTGRCRCGASTLRMEGIKRKIREGADVKSLPLSKTFL